MEKFEGVSLITTMREIWKAHTFGKIRYAPYAELWMQDADFQFDEHLRLLWMLVLPDAVKCYRAWDVMRAGTVENRKWLSHAEQNDYMVSAYAVMPSTLPGPMLFGDIYTMDYQNHVLRVALHAVPMSAMVAHHMDGHETRLEPDEIDTFESADDITGFTKEYDEEAVRGAVSTEIINQENGRDGNWYSHVKSIPGQRLFFEAARITRQIDALPEPNTYGKNHFVLPAPEFINRLSDAEKDTFLSYIPYNSLCIVDGEDGQGPQLAIYGCEVMREREERAPSTSPAKKKTTKDKER